MSISWLGVIGALGGAALGYLNYAVIVGIVEARLRALDRSATAAEREAFERKIVLLRRLVLSFELIVVSAVGYALGWTLEGWLGAGG